MRVKTLLVFAALFAFGVVMFGAFVRLSNAGLSCPDWPTCYGKLSWPTQGHEIAHANAAFPDRPVEAGKPWREQVHRFLAGTLGMMVLVLAFAAAWHTRQVRRALIFATLCAASGMALYVHGEHALSALALLAIVLPLLGALALPREGTWRALVAVFGVLVCQAMLGMWTVTLLLKPIVVMGHLLGGLATFALLAWAALRLHGVAAMDDRHAALRHRVVLGLALLIAQITLGGWTSANYAALACGIGSDAFPRCLGQWWPASDFHEAFVLWRGIGVNYEGGVLDAAARTAIQLTHRLGALAVSLYLLWLAWRSARDGWRRHAQAIVVVLLAQIALGIGNVWFGLPLVMATLHHGMAMLLLFVLLATLARTQAVPKLPIDTDLRPSAS